VHRRRDSRRTIDDVERPAAAQGVKLVRRRPEIDPEHGFGAGETGDGHHRERRAGRGLVKGDELVRSAQREDHATRRRTISRDGPIHRRIHRRRRIHARVCRLRHRVITARHEKQQSPDRDVPHAPSEVGDYTLPLEKDCGE
jgi:hypothetical protein